MEASQEMLHAAVIILSLIVIAILAFVLARKKGYPWPGLWALFSTISLLPLVYLIIRRPYSERHPRNS